MHGHAAVFDAVAAFVMVKVIGFAIGDDQKQAALAGLFGKAFGDMADRRPKPRIVAGGE